MSCELSDISSLYLKKQMTNQAFEVVEDLRPAKPTAEVKKMMLEWQV
jgi:hypothetical protein